MALSLWAVCVFRHACAPTNLLSVVPVVVGADLFAAARRTTAIIENFMTNCTDFSFALELKPFVQLLHREAQAYSQKHFPKKYNDILNSFCNAAQLGGGLRNFYRLCVAVPAALGHKMLGTFYLYDIRKRRLEKVCDTAAGLFDPPEPVDTSMPPSRQPYETADMLVFPLFSRPPRQNERVELPWTMGSDNDIDYCYHLQNPDPFESRLNILGMFSVRPLSRLFHEDRLFFKTLVRWIGYELNKRLLTVQNLRHLCFINSLGRDIGHNVIIPNMRFRYLFMRLAEKIDAIRSLERDMAGCLGGTDAEKRCGGLLFECQKVREELEACHHDLTQQHTQISLFLESLFREEHFKYGHLVLRPGKCFVEQDIILPQLEVYAGRFAAHGITIDKPRNMFQQEFPLMVDVGLLSQVYANLFSNAIKYASEIVDHRGLKRKALAYGCEEVPDFPVPGMKGVKFNVFTTGPPLSEEECREIFMEGRRGLNHQGIHGTGHGLAFIRRVVEAHGGKVGCEPTEQGNNFYFILPLSDMDKITKVHQDGCPAAASC